MKTRVPNEQSYTSQQKQCNTSHGPKGVSETWTEGIYQYQCVSFDVAKAVAIGCYRADFGFGLIDLEPPGSFTSYAYKCDLYSNHKGKAQLVLEKTSVQATKQSYTPERMYCKTPKRRYGLGQTWPSEFVEYKCIPYWKPIVVTIGCYGSNFGYGLVKTIEFGNYLSKCELDNNSNSRLVIEWDPLAEENSPTCSEHRSFKCGTTKKKCISKRRVCDGDDDCGDWSDEQMCALSACPIGWTTVGRVCYKSLNKRLNFRKAVQKCYREHKRAVLPYFDSENEWKDFKGFVNYEKQFALGYTDMLMANKFDVITGFSHRCPARYVNWAPGQPKEGGKIRYEHGKMCVAAGNSNEMKFQEVPCGSVTNIVCQIRLTEYYC